METEIKEVKHRADLKECINRIHERLFIIENKFNIRLSEEDKDLFMDLKRDILVPLSKSELNSQQKQNLRQTDKGRTLNNEGVITCVKYGEDKTADNPTQIKIEDSYAEGFNEGFDNGRKDAIKEVLDKIDKMMQSKTDLKEEDRYIDGEELKQQISEVKQ